MARITLRQLLDHAAERRYGAPVILQASRGARSYARDIMRPAMDEMRVLCAGRFVAFGTDGQASRIRVVPLADMARRYRSLDPRLSDPPAAAA